MDHSKRVIKDSLQPRTFDKPEDCSYRFGKDLFMKYISVRVVDSSGRPKKNVRVIISANQFLAAGGFPPVYTNSDGLARFDLNIDDSAKIEISVGYKQVVGLSKPKSEYFITI